MEAADRPKAVGSSRTNGFLFSDLRNYTKFVEAHGDAAAAALLDRYRRIVRREVAEFGGAEIKTEGDSFYVVFPSASGAVQCGLAIVRATDEEAREAGEPPIQVGIGVHAGETVETEEGFVGSAVNIAARVCSQAAAGEVLVTDTVRGLIRTSAPVRFVERGARRLKGIEEPVALYRVEPLGEGHHHGTDRKRRAGDVVASKRVRAALLVAVVLLVAGSAGAWAVLGGSRAAPGSSPNPDANPTLAAIASASPTARSLGSPDGDRQDGRGRAPRAAALGAPRRPACAPRRRPSGGEPSRRSAATCRWRTMPRPSGTTASIRSSRSRTSCPASSRRRTCRPIDCTPRPVARSGQLARRQYL